MILRAILGWTFAGLYWTAFISLCIICLGQLPDSFSAAVIRLWGRTMLRIAGVKLQYLNESTLQGRCSRVIVINHQSALDILWGAAILPEGALGIGKKEIIFIPMLNLLWWFFGFIRIDRSNPAQSHQALANVADLVRENDRSLIMAPEGTRSPTPDLLPFKKGAFRIAIQAQVPIYPVLIKGAFELWPKTQLMPKPGTIKIQFLPPIPTQGMRLENLDGLVSQVRSEMERALKGM